MAGILYTTNIAIYSTSRTRNTSSCTSVCMHVRFTKSQPFPKKRFLILYKPFSYLVQSLIIIYNAIIVSIGHLRVCPKLQVMYRIPRYLIKLETCNFLEKLCFMHFHCLSNFQHFQNPLGLQPMSRNLQNPLNSLPKTQGQYLYPRNFRKCLNSYVSLVTQILYI